MRVIASLIDRSSYPHIEFRVVCDSDNCHRVFHVSLWDEDREEITRDELHGTLAEAIAAASFGLTVELNHLLK